MSSLGSDNSNSNFNSKNSIRSSNGHRSSNSNTSSNSKSKRKCNELSFYAWAATQGRDPQKAFEDFGCRLEADLKVM